MYRVFVVESTDYSLSDYSLRRVRMAEALVQNHTVDGFDASAPRPFRTIRMPGQLIPQIDDFQGTHHSFSQPATASRISVSRL